MFRTKTRLFLIVGAVVLCGAALALRVPKFAALYWRSVTTPSPGRSQTAGDKVWLTEEWTGNNKPYAAIRAEIDGLAARGQIQTRDIDDYERVHHWDEKNPVSMYRWLYTQLAAAYQQPGIYTSNVDTYSVIVHAKDPQSYDYIRLRYLSSPTDIVDNGAYLALGKRLLAKDPQDGWVETKLIHDLNAWESPQNKKEALHYATDLVKRHPNNPRVYATIASVYYECWMRTFDQNDGAETIRWNKIFVQREIAGKDLKEGAQGTIARIEKVTAYERAHPDWPSERARMKGTGKIWVAPGESTPDWKQIESVPPKPPKIVAVSLGSQPVTEGVLVLLSAQAESDFADRVLTYQWSAAGSAPSPVQFPNGRNASTISAVFPKAGKYRVQVKVTDGAGQSANRLVTVTVAPVGGPARVTATPGDHVVVLTWPAVASATAYTVYHVDDGKYTPVGWIRNADTGFADTAIDNGTHYRYVVTASMGDQESRYSAPMAFVTPQVQPGYWAIIYKRKASSARAPQSTLALSARATSAKGVMDASADIQGSVPGGSTVQAEASREGYWTATWKPSSPGAWPTLLSLNHSHGGDYRLEVTHATGVATITSADGSVNYRTEFPAGGSSPGSQPLGPSPVPEAWTTTDPTCPVRTSILNNDAGNAPNSAGGMFRWVTVGRNDRLYYTQAYLKAHFANPGAIVMRFPVPATSITATVHVTSASSTGSSISADATSQDVVAEK
ncbi:MAG: PKD domain-containing protein [Capsulimonas sp.]|uniref:PKD domain-containing protein n=1 Tax=Capsulimonas sp. TaxID=2494211 RepID=UPI003262ED6F